MINIKYVVLCWGDLGSSEEMCSVVDDSSLNRRVMLTAIGGHGSGHQTRKKKERRMSHNVCIFLIWYWLFVLFVVVGESPARYRRQPTIL